MIVIVVMPMVFAFAIITVDPVMAVLGPMARNPDHFPIAIPIPRTMGVIGAIAYFNDDAVAANDGW